LSKAGEQVGKREATEHQYEMYMKTLRTYTSILVRASHCMNLF